MTLQDIKQLARETIETYNPDGLVPFPFEQLATAQANLDILYSDTLPQNVSGAIFLEADRFKILINNTKPNVRRYFTVAHELGHYFIHRDWLEEHSTSGFVDYSDTLENAEMLLRSDEPHLVSTIDLQKEREANSFAAELIMPEDEVRQFWNITHDISKCASAFQVSQSAMAIRLERLRIS